MIVNITGVFYLPSGVVASSRMVAFKPIDRSVRAGYLGGLVPDPVIIQTGIDGSVDFNLLTGSYFVTIETKDTDNIGRGLIFAGKANVPDAPSASISEILDAAVAPDEPPVWYTQAIQAAEDAIDAAVAAQAWAESPTPPGGAGTESAKTAANRAEQAAQDAEDAAASMGNAVRYDAQTLTAPQQAQARSNIGAASSATAAVNTRTITAGTGLTGGGDLTADRTLAADFATEAEALAGVATDKVMSPARTMAAIQSTALGEGQDWQDVTATRTHSTTYTNTTGRAIACSVEASGPTSRFLQVTDSTGAWVSVGVAFSQWSQSQFFVVPAGRSYRISGSITISRWVELR